MFHLSISLKKKHVFSETLSPSMTKQNSCTWSMGCQLRAEELMKTMPTRDTVAGEALSMLCTSNTSLQDGDMVMRSPLARVSVLLSSNTELRFSIHMASTGPSSTIHMNSPVYISKPQFSNSFPHFQLLFLLFCPKDNPFFFLQVVSQTFVGDYSYVDAKFSIFFFKLIQAPYIQFFR